MRENTFRGKRKDNGQWVHGFYTEDALQANSMIAKVAIQPAGCYPVEVDEDTVGQYRPDIKAFDGDWITAETNIHPSCKIEGVLIFHDMECAIEQNDDNFPVCSFSVIDRLSVNVSGKNIYDNPELLK